MRKPLSTEEKYPDQSLISVDRLFLRIHSYLERELRFEVDDNHHIMIIYDVFNFSIYF
jgi:hypothetical protein